MKLKKFIMFTLVAMTLGGCASGYRPVNPEHTQMQAKVETDEMNLSYEYDILRKNGNKKYAKKENLNRYKVIAVGLENKTDRTISVDKDLTFFANGQQLVLLSPHSYTNRLKQSTASYLFYLLLTPLNLTTQDSRGRITNSFPIGLGLGPAIAFGNMAGSSSANSKFEQNMQNDSILGKSIAPGETLKGLITISNSGYSPLTVEVREI